MVIVEVFLVLFRGRYVWSLAWSLDEEELELSVDVCCTAGVLPFCGWMIVIAGDWWEGRRVWCSWIDLSLELGDAAGVGVGA